MVVSVFSTSCLWLHPTAVPPSDGDTGTAVFEVEHPAAVERSMIAGMIDWPDILFLYNLDRFDAVGSRNAGYVETGGKPCHIDTGA